jgi:hypothetical protein
MTGRCNGFAGPAHHRRIAESGRRRTMLPVIPALRARLGSVLRSARDANRARAAVEWQAKAVVPLTYHAIQGIA